MAAEGNPEQSTSAGRALSGRLELADRLYREFRTRCFWHSPPDLVITEELIPFVVKGLRTHGGHQGFQLATQLQDQPAEVSPAPMLTLEERRFLDVFLHEATTSPFTGPATEALHQLGVAYGDVSFLAWAYHREVSRSGPAWGHAADSAPPLPWSDWDSALHRNEEIRGHWAQERQLSARSLR